MVSVVLMLGINGSQFDVQKLFHLYKPNYDRHSAITGKQNDDKKSHTIK